MELLQSPGLLNPAEALMVWYQLCLVPTGCFGSDPKVVPLTNEQKGLRVISSQWCYNIACYSGVII